MILGTNHLYQEHGTRHHGGACAHGSEEASVAVLEDLHKKAQWTLSSGQPVRRVHTIPSLTLDMEELKHG